MQLSTRHASAARARHTNRTGELSYQPLKKSARPVVNECSLALARAVNSVAFNVLGLPTTREGDRPWMDGIPAAQPLWDKWVAHTTGFPTVWLWPTRNDRMWARRSLSLCECWLGGSDGHNTSV